ncbi:MAG: hypothetical protein QXX71_03110 [Candidatus Nanoarchaeia archaeon]|nr:hypothetical protein [Candidatus Haiyanarchaeum thermophilum]MCW1306952.1 hypothetical protein [Candidatus Haiyanarchaeum thermophilum]
MISATLGPIPLNLSRNSLASSVRISPILSGSNSPFNMALLISFTYLALYPSPHFFCKAEIGAFTIFSRLKVYPSPKFLLRQDSILLTRFTDVFWVQSASIIPHFQSRFLITLKPLAAAMILRM